MKKLATRKNGNGNLRPNNATMNTNGNKIKIVLCEQKFVPQNNTTRKNTTVKSQAKRLPRIEMRKSKLEMIEILFTKNEKFPLFPTHVKDLKTEIFYMKKLENLFFFR